MILVFIRGADKTAAVFLSFGFANKNGLVYRYSSDRVTEINFRLSKADRGKEHIHNPSYLSDIYAAKVSPKKKGT